MMITGPVQWLAMCLICMPSRLVYQN